MSEPALSIRHLRKVYANQVIALGGVDLAVERGDFFALLGANGAGKSTLIGILCGLVNKTSGDVRVFGDDLDVAPYKVRRHIGIVPQEFNFSPFEKVEEILVQQAGYYGVPRRTALQRSAILLKQLELWEKRHEVAMRLSGGMKRRLMIARALVHQPRILVLDEPTAGVDINIRRNMWTFLRELNESGCTIILTTHYLEEAEQLCRHVAIIDAGQIIDNTTMVDLLNRLDQQTLIFDAATPLPANLPTERAYERRSATSFALTVATTVPLNTLFQEFNQHGLVIKSMRNETNRLEQLFLERTEVTPA